MNSTRTKNSIKNIKVTTFTEISNKILAFIIRTVFIKTLSADLLGLNGLFTNILTMLSLAELGFGTAIIFSMYKPVADGDKEKVKVLLNLYKKVYNIVGFIVFGGGLCLLPFIPYFVNGTVDANIHLVFLLFLINTTISYFFTYKRSIIIANQEQRKISLIEFLTYLMRAIFEIIFLYLTRNFIIYLVIEIICTFLQNLVISIVADKSYPYICEQSNIELPEIEKKEIFDNVKSLMVYKVGSVIMGGTDNIIMSKMINITIVGVCSNYIMIINAVKGILSQVINSISGSIGNLNSTSDTKKKEKVFYNLTFLHFVLYLNISVLFLNLLTPFIKIWAGKGYVLDDFTLIFLVLSIYIEGLRRPALMYRETLGIFKYGKQTPYIGTVVNIFSSIVLCKMLGVAGIFIGTSLAQLSSYSWIDPYLIHKKVFKTSFSKYLCKTFEYAVFFLVVVLVNKVLSIFLFGGSIYMIVLKTFLNIVIINMLVVLRYLKDQDFNNLIHLLQRFVTKV